MELRKRHTLLSLFEVSIHKLNPSEISLIGEFVRLHDLNHPIKHSGPKQWRDLMSFKEIILLVA
jgi:hypothetical protein